MPNEAVEVFTDIGQTITDWQSHLFTQSVWYTLAMALIVAAITYLLLRLLKRVLTRRAKGNYQFFYRLLSMVLIVLAVLMVMMTIQPLATLSRTILAGSGLLAVVIGIAAQASLANVFSGISIGMSRPFVIGESIEIIGKDITGTVTEINLRHTIIRDLNNKDIVIPNSVIDQEVVRAIPSDAHRIANYLKIGIGYGSDLDKAIGILKEAVLAHKDFYDARPPEDVQGGPPPDVTVAVTDLTPSAIMLRATVWSKDAGTGFMMLSDLRQTVLKRFRQEDIDPPDMYQNVVVRR